ncbi:hypothetical protein LUZ61_016866 [Rhynchospora tenuis]|uniref:GRAS family transcription factor n=1 Tax=Rhynchospora tenuis TaxID=198213 RepID=A0AAD5Z6B7_9POAL|nr:hypothetical protein LUZ61_016866 [Rhynchospora tenuis]
MASTALPHGNFHEDGNNVHIPCTPQPLLESYQTITPAFSSDNNNQNAAPNQLLSDAKINHEVCDLTSNAVINYISQILLEEDIDEDIYQEEAALRDTEKSFYDILKNEYPLSPTSTQFNANKRSDITDSGSRHTTYIVSKNNMQSYSKSKTPSINADPIYALSVGNLPATQIQKGAEQALKFLPAIGKLFIELEPKGIEVDEEDKTCYVSENKAIYHESHTKKCALNDRGSDLSEGQAHKQRAVSSDEPARNEHLEQFLLFRDVEYVKEITSVRKTVKQEIKNNSWEHQDKHSENEIRKKETKKGCVDLQSLLIHCSEAVSTNDDKRACELISEIRKYSSPRGDCYQRLAHYLVYALEARLAGTGSDIYRELLSWQGNISDTLKAARIYHAICPFLRAWYYFSNQTILNASKGATKIHIIDFGIQMGFMWPSFFERLSSLGSAAPKIRITGIGFPERGFRPGKLVEATGRRLSEYAQRFNIDFKYQGIASKWENITIEDLKISKDEVSVVNCLLGLKNITDIESIGRDNPRDKVLRLIKEIKPCVFIHEILNGSYGTPFFTARFKEVLRMFFSFFDIYEATIPRESEMRIHIERNILIPQAINAIACEGSERVERPETYRQWQARTIRAGFTQLPVDSMIMKNIENYVRDYHKEFFVDEDRKWLRLGWKGTILFALSTWKPNEYESVDSKAK